MGDAPEQYFAAEPAVASSPKTIELHLPDASFRLRTDRGVFAGDAVDAGTKTLLLEAPLPSPHGDLLDLGCGYGPIALTLGVRAPRASVWAVDVNRRARDLTAANAAANDVTNVTVCAPDEVPAAVRFTTIWSNPPVRIGKPELHALLARWLDRLTPEGRAWLVVQKHLGSDSLATWLDAQGWPTARRASHRGFRILEITARAPQ